MQAVCLQKFQALWDSGVTVSEHSTLRDASAEPDDPMPYCVMETSPSNTTDRMSGQDDANREIRDVEIIFSVNARSVDGDSRTSDEIAAYLIEEITKVFGGHPTVSPTALTLDVGNFLIAQYQDDVGIRTGDDEYQWRVTYLFRIDVPVAI